VNRVANPNRPCFSRRRLLAGTAGGALALAAPAVLRAQPAPIKIGLLHPVTGFLAFSGQQCREGALMAIEAINAAAGSGRSAAPSSSPCSATPNPSPKWVPPKSRR